MFDIFAGVCSQISSCKLVDSGMNYDIYHGNILSGLSDQMNRRPFSVPGEHLTCPSGGVEDLPKFNAIHVGAAAEQLPPSLVDALLPNGRMVIPVGPRHRGGQQSSSQELMLVDKSSDGRVTIRPIMGVSYVPLTPP